MSTRRRVKRDSFENERTIYEVMYKIVASGENCKCSTMCIFCRCTLIWCNIYVYAIMAKVHFMFVVDSVSESKEKKKLKNDGKLLRERQLK